MKKTSMTLNLTDAEWSALDALAKKKSLTKTAVMRQALRLYQLVDVRLDRGERIVFQDDLQKASSDLIVL